MGIEPLSSHGLSLKAALQINNIIIFTCSFKKRTNTEFSLISDDEDLNQFNLILYDQNFIFFVYRIAVNNFFLNENREINFSTD